MAEELDYKKIDAPSIDGKTISSAEWAKNTIRLRFTDGTGFICHFTDNGEPYLLNDDDAFKEAEEKTKHITDFVLKEDEK